MGILLVVRLYVLKLRLFLPTMMLHRCTEIEFPRTRAVTPPNHWVFTVPFHRAYTLKGHRSGRYSPFHALGYGSESRSPSQHVRYIGSVIQVFKRIYRSGRKKGGVLIHYGKQCGMRAFRG